MKMKTMTAKMMKMTWDETAERKGRLNRRKKSDDEDLRRKEKMMKNPRRMKRRRTTKLTVPDRLAHEAAVSWKRMRRRMKMMMMKQKKNYRYAEWSLPCPCRCPKQTQWPHLPPSRANLMGELGRARAREAREERE